MTVKNAELSLSVDNNPHRLPSDRELHAVLTVTAQTSGTPQVPATTTTTAAPEVAEVIILDTSGSMASPYDKLPAAQRATQAAIEALRDGAHFAVVAGNERARVVYPAGRELAVAGRATKRAAARAVRDIHANGGTAIGQWLTLAGQLLNRRPGAIRHALLFTDGQNGESRQELDRVLDRWSGEFSCDARGIGSDYLATEVIRIVSALDGQADAIAAFGDLEAEMRAIMDNAMRKQVASVALQIRPMTGAGLRFLKQTYPTRVDLTERLSAADGAQVLDTGAWGDERREYHLCLDIEPPARISGRPSVAARVAVTISESVTQAAQAKVMVHWTEDATASLRLDPSVAHTMDQAEMGQAIDAGCAALRRGDKATAERHLGRAVQLAEQSGDSESRKRLERLVMIEDAAVGKVRLRSKIDEVDLLRTEMQTVRSSMFTASAPPDEHPREDIPPAPEAAQEPDDRPSITCAVCREENSPDAEFCEDCSSPLEKAR